MSMGLKCLGRLESARDVAQRAFHLQGRDDPIGEFASLPIMDKSGLLASAHTASMLGVRPEDAFLVIASSGSSGQATFWPQLRGPAVRTAALLRGYLETGFQIHERHTLAIVGLALGSWIGGDYVSWAMKDVALGANYPFAVITPGSKHEEVLRIIERAAPCVEQILLAVCPSAIGHLHLLAHSLGIAIPENKMRYLVLGEPFPETLRERLRLITGAACPILSLYGSADTGLLGAESPASAALRALLEQSPRLAEQLQLPSPVPHLFHAAAPDAFLEEIDGELVVTRWQGVPLVRYNLHDRVSFVSWNAARDAVAATSEGDPALRALVIAAGNTPQDLIAVAGRTDRCLILCGTNISESMLDAACSALAADSPCTGAYAASIVFDGTRQRLALTLEVRGPELPSHQQDAEIYGALVQSLSRVQPEFADDWHSVYRRWDADPVARILRLEYVAWPAISRRPDGQIKARGIFK